MATMGRNFTPPTSPVIDKRRSRVEHVMEVVSEWIVQQQLKPDEPLPSEAQLAEHFAVSRTVVREAVRLLAERGLIEVVHGKRHRVRPPSPELVGGHLRRMIERGAGTLRELMEIRWPLETAIALVAARRRTDEDIAAMRACLEAEAKTLEAQIQQDMRFHKLLARATGNTMFEMVLGVFEEPLAEGRRRSLKHAGQALTHKQHGEILDAVEAKKDALAEALMKTHLDTAMGVYRQYEAEKGKASSD